MLARVALWIAGLYAAAYLLRAQTVRLKYFTPSEFGVWFPLMDRQLLIKLDRFRELIGRPVYISPDAEALGRPNGSTGSMHFPAPLVRAADVIIPGAQFPDILAAARAAGFHGIGLYTVWGPPGAHLDVRPDRTPDNPATWSDVGQRTAAGERVYVEIERALA